MKSGDNCKCAILVPVARHIEPECERALQWLERSGHVVRRVWGYSDISRGRSQIVTDALAEGFEELIWVDSDIAFDPRDLAKLRAHNLPAVGAIYPVKGQRRLTCITVKGTSEVKFGQQGGLMEVEALGGGFIHTRREVYDKVRSACALPHCKSISPHGIIPFFLPLIVQREGDDRPVLLGEDLSFCERIRLSGIKIFADTTIRLHHVGRYLYSWEDAGGVLERAPNFTLTLPPGDTSSASPGKES